MSTAAPTIRTRVLYLRPGQRVLLAGQAFEVVRVVARTHGARVTFALDGISHTEFFRRSDVLLRLV